MPNAEQQVAQLAKIPRTGWLIRGVEQPETVADHTFGTMVLAMLFDDHPPKLYPASTLVLALVHDIQELRTGDLTPRTKKYVHEQDARTSYADFERNHFHAVLQSLPDASRSYLGKIWDEYAKERTKRARATHVLDVVEMLSQAYEYEKTGQHKLDEFWQWVRRCERVPKLFDLARAIERKRNFLKASIAVRFQHFEATEHHSGKYFADKQIEQDKREWSERDNLVRTCFRNAPLASSKKVKVLDVGCGLGSFSRFFLQSDRPRAQVTGIDINEFLLAEAQKIWEGRDFVARRADIGWYWNFDPDSFDVVMVGEVLEHIFDPWLVMMEAYRVLKPGGLLFVSVPNSFNKPKLKRMIEEGRIEVPLARGAHPLFWS